MKLTTLVLPILLSGLVTTVHAQSQNYGPNITLEQAKKVLAAAEAEAVKQKWTVAISIVDTAGNMVAYEKIDNTQIASVKVSLDKATTAVGFKRPSKALQDTIAAGGAGLRMLTIDSITAVEGGIPLVVNNEIVGAIGVSGMASDQDSVVAAAGVAGLK